MAAEISEVEKEAIYQIIDGVVEFRELIYDGAKAKRSWQICVKLQIDGEEVDILPEYITSPDPTWNKDNGYVALHYVKSLQVGGKVRDSVPTAINDGKNKGRKNFTNCLTQAIKEATSHFNKQLKKAQPIDRPLPMLAKKFGSSKAATPIFDGTEFILQRKLDGIRCVISKPANGPLTAYSRTGMLFTGYDDIIRSVEILLGGEPGPVYIDGEIYKHGLELQTISGNARKGDVSDLTLNIFDIFYGDKKMAIDRQHILDALFMINPNLPNIAHVESFYVTSQDEIDFHYNNFMKEGYEGAMLRKPTSEYQYGNLGHHSSDLLKIKKVLDNEFEIVDFTRGTKGKDLDALVWICATKEKKQFHVVPKNMTYDERYANYKELMKIIKINGITKTKFEHYVKGLPMTVEYAQMSKDNVPLQSKALMIRTQDDNMPNPLENMFEKLTV